MFDTFNNENGRLLLDWVVLEVQEPASPVASAKVKRFKEKNMDKKDPEKPVGMGF